MNNSGRLAGGAIILFLIGMIGWGLTAALTHYTDKYIPTVIDNQLEAKVKVKVGEIVQPIVKEQTDQLQGQISSIQSNVNEVPKLRDDIKELTKSNGSDSF